MLHETPFYPVITVTTDFGSKDHFVGAMKGVILRICPAAHIIDISHDVSPYQIRQSCYLLSQSWHWFPPRTIHVAVVDPGVGGERKAIALHSNNHYFVGPDNGILSCIQGTAREITNADLMLPFVSGTFHGRDIFAPVAAHLANGVSFGEVGSVIEHRYKPLAADSVLHIDHFGNVITGITDARTLRIRGTLISTRMSNYEQAEPGELFMIVGSSGFIEISIRQSSAAVRLGCHAGDPVERS